MFISNKSPKAPAKKTDEVMSVFNKTVDDLTKVAIEHDEYAAAQREIAANATREAEEATREAQTARDSIAALRRITDSNQGQ